MTLFVPVNGHRPNFNEHLFDVTPTEIKNGKSTRRGVKLTPRILNRIRMIESSREGTRGGGVSRDARARFARRLRVNSYPMTQPVAHQEAPYFSTPASYKLY